VVISITNCYIRFTLLYLIYLAIRGPCSNASRQGSDVVWPASTSGVWPHHIRPLCLQSATDCEPHCWPVSSEKVWRQPTISTRHFLPSNDCDRRLYSWMDDQAELTWVVD